MDVDCHYLTWSITLVNTVSIHHLQIFEKERDWEYFGIDYTVKDKTYPIFFLSKENIMDPQFVTTDDVNSLVKKIITDYAEKEDFNIYNNTDEEGVLDFTDFSESYMMMLFYQHEFIPKTFINPDVFQTEELLMKDEYPLVLDAYNIPDVMCYCEDCGYHEKNMETCKKCNSSNIRKVKTMLLEPDQYSTGDGVYDIPLNKVYPESVEGEKYPCGHYKPDPPTQSDESVNLEQIVCVIGHNEEVEDNVISELIEIQETNQIGGDS